MPTFSKHLPQRPKETFVRLFCLRPKLMFAFGKDPIEFEISYTTIVGAVLKSVLRYSDSGSWNGKHNWQNARKPANNIYAMPAGKSRVHFLKLQVAFHFNCFFFVLFSGNGQFFHLTTKCTCTNKGQYMDKFGPS